jgi:hypothetical protein
MHFAETARSVSLVIKIYCAALCDLFCCFRSCFLLLAVLKFILRYCFWGAVDLIKSQTPNCWCASFFPHAFTTRLPRSWIQFGSLKNKSRMVSVWKGTNALPLFPLGSAPRLLEYNKILLSRSSLEFRRNGREFNSP